MISIQDKTERIAQLTAIAENYVLKGLGDKNFESIPYHDEVSLRAPINQGGSEMPIVGKSNLRQKWWAPLPNLIGRVELMETYVNKSLTSVSVEFHCEIINPTCTLRIMDRFKIDHKGLIVEQENFFDPRRITNPE